MKLIIINVLIFFISLAHAKSLESCPDFSGIYDIKDCTFKNNNLYTPDDLYSTLELNKKLKIVQNSNEIGLADLDGIYNPHNTIYLSLQDLSSWNLELSNVVYTCEENVLNVFFQLKEFSGVSLYNVTTRYEIMLVKNADGSVEITEKSRLKLLTSGGFFVEGSSANCLLK